MTPFPYINPYHLPGISADKTLLPTQLRKVKKELMAEFELHDSADITVGHVKLSKSEVMAFFEGLEDKEVRDHHKALQQISVLLGFLEKGETDLFAEKKYAEMSQKMEGDTDLQEFVTPFYCFQFNQLLLKTFKQKDEEKLQLLLGQPNWVKVTEQHACYDATFKQLQLEVEGVKRLADGLEHGNTAPGPEIQDAIDENWIHLLNILPSSFDGLINAYAKGLEGLSLALFNTYDRAKLAKYVLRQGLKLRLNTETSGRLQYVLDQLLKFSDDDSFTMEDVQEVFENNKKRPKVWQIALGGLVVIWVVSLLF